MADVNTVRQKAPELPAAADGAIEIVQRLVEAGHSALLAGGCVRDLLLRCDPHDYDVATDARPQEVQRLFRATRHVGVQFGVVLVRKRGRWIEVATFRSDGQYLDGRHPVEVHFSDARHDALRRDFTVNGMFLDPLKGEIIDYVGGRADLDARVIRAIGEASARFAEDHLRLLRAVRFAARLDFAIEPATLAAIQANAANLARVAPERVREELEKILRHARRAAGLQMLRETGLLGYLWPGAAWHADALREAAETLAALPAEAAFETAFAALLAGRTPTDVHEIARKLKLSNDQREITAWLVEHAADLDQPAALSLADFKRLMAHPAFEYLCHLAAVRHTKLPEGRQRTAALYARARAIPDEHVAPKPLVTGEDLAARGIAPGPIYKRVLDALYTCQLNERLVSREAALVRLDDLLAEESA